MVRNRNGTWWMAAIEPAGDPARAANQSRTGKPKQVLALPKGLVDPGEKAAETALTQIERQFGKGSIMRLGAKEFVPISAISTGNRPYRVSTLTSRRFGK